MTALTGSISLDGGSIWRPLTVSSNGAGRYDVRFTVPDASDPNGFADLRIRATDQAGGTLTQSVTRAFAVREPGGGGSTCGRGTEAR